MEQLDPKKVKLLDDFKKLSEGKSSEELIPLVLAFVDKAKKDGISFTREETTMLFEKFKI